jgi:hypothetical protein
MTDVKTTETPVADKAAPKAKERSPNYPALTLTDTIALAKKLYEKDKRTTVSSESAAKSLGWASLSGGARTAIASLRQYGLVETVGDGIRISDLAMAILHHPIESDERRDAISTAAVKPPLIAELIGTHADASDETLKAYLIMKRKFSAEGAGRFIAAFRDALKLAGPEASLFIPKQLGAENGADPSKLTTEKGPKLPPPKLGEQMQFTWPLSGDVVATLTVSRQIETDDVETLGDYFKIAQKALLKAARKKEAPDNGSETKP